MRILVNALTVTNISGKHVLFGHFARFAVWTAAEHEYFILFHRANRDIRKEFGPNVHWIECPGYTSHWAARSLWERTRLNALVRRLNADILLTTSGTVVPGLSIPQISYAMNPWALVPGIHFRMSEKIKAALQRRAYRQAMRVADTMLFLSEYMRQAYRKNAEFNEKSSEVVYTGIDDEIYTLAGSLRTSVRKKPLQIVSVSVMAPHKWIETVVQALSLLHRSFGINASLLLVGGWPDPVYEQGIRALVRELGLEGAVTFKGHVSREELYRLYAESSLFCLMSRCESFGIPAVEAQAFGTPVVSSNCCAIPEVCGAGGIYPAPDDTSEVAVCIARLLTDNVAWEKLSRAAVENAARYRWDICSRPFVRIFGGDRQPSPFRDPS